MNSSAFIALLAALACVSATLASPIPGAPARDNVVIVGAGMSGVAAAQVLLSTNVTFSIVEASNRTGGRMQASSFGHPSIGNYVVEFGANWIHGAGPTNPMWQVAQTINLRTSLVPNSTADVGNYAVYDENGKPTPPNHLANLVEEFRAAFKCANETAQTIKQDESIATALHDCGWHANSIVAETLEWEGTASDGGIIEADMSLFGNFPDGTYKWFGADDRLVIDQNPRGYSKIVDTLVGDKIDDLLHLNTMVTQVDVTCDGVTLTAADGSTYESDYALLTLPLGILQKQHETLFKNNPLPQAQVDALQMYQRGNFTKIFGQWADPFWDLTIKNFLGSHKLPGHHDYVFAEFHNLAHKELIPGSNILFMAVVEPASTYMENLNDEDAKGIVMEWLQTIFSNATVPEPMAFHMTRHGTDPLSYMAYSATPVGFTDDLFKAAFAPVAAVGCKDAPRVFFLGEAACRGMNGYTHGAYESGRAGAFTVLEKMGYGRAPENICNKPLR